MEDQATFMYVVSRVVFQRGPEYILFAKRSIMWIPLPVAVYPAVAISALNID